MTSTNQGSFRLFRVAGIDVYLHWSWFIAAYILIKLRAGRYTSLTWNVLEYLTLFFIVLLHEFGHSLACRQVGGRADRIVLWPLGGVAYVDPPQRPRAILWSLAAGPLVNVVLAPVLWLVWILGAFIATANVSGLLESIFYINLGLLIFNLLPIYPLDGGQILRSLLWFVFGRAWSLIVVTTIGFLGVAGLVLLAVVTQSYWTGIMAAFILLNCWNGLRQAVQLIRAARTPRRDGLACPACGVAPPTGPLWGCGQCRKPFDFFENHGVCPHCGAAYIGTRCLECGKDSPISAWFPAPQTLPPPAPLPVLPE